MSADKSDSERVAWWMMQRGYATGHGDTVEDMLAELEAQARESGKERIIADRINADMLSALREVEPFLDDQADADDGIPNDAMRHLTEVRAAIAKAEGSQR